MRIKVYYSMKGVRYSVIVTGFTSGCDACDYVRENYGPCKIIGVEYLD